jgi:hypothetical protein
MTALQGFLQGLMVSWTPSLIFLTCVALQAGTRRHLASRYETEASKATEGVTIYVPHRDCFAVVTVDAYRELR